MKPKIKPCLAALIACAFTSAAALSATNVVIDWHQPDQYTDLGTHFHDHTNLNTFKKELEPYVVRIANDHLPDGTTLELTITDVDLAGEFEPWRPETDVRIVRTVYPPRMSLQYSVFDVRGELVDSGEADIVDPTFDFNIGQRFLSQDRFFYERDLIASWIRNDLSVAIDKIIRKKQRNA